MFAKNLYQKNFLVTFLGILAVNLLITTALYIFLIEKGKKNIYNDYTTTAEIDFVKTQKFIEAKLIHFKNMLNSIDNSKEFDNYLITKERNGISDIFEILLGANSYVTQLRFINKNGFEEIRIEKNNIGKVVEANHLQNKSSRYYFDKTINLQKDEFYISSLDLNIEDEKIEIPYKPTIRVSKPVYRNDEVIGMLIINYNAQDIIESIQVKEYFEVFYMDKEGNFFLHPDRNKSYSTQLNNNYKVSDEIPNIYSLIDSEKSDEINNKYYINKLDYLDSPVFIIYSLKDGIYQKMYREIKSESLYLFFIVFIITLPLIIYISNIQAIHSTILESIINNTPFPIFLKDKNGKIIIANNALVLLSNFETKEQLIGKRVSEIMDLNHAQKFEIKEDKLINETFFTNEIEVYSKDGKQYFYDMKMLKIQIFGFIKKVYLLGIAVDITAIKSANLHLKELVDEEVKKGIELETFLMHQSKMAEMGSMLDNILHQWKQPLSIISVCNSEMQVYAENNMLNVDMVKNNVQHIKEQIEFMSNTSNDFRDFFSPNKQIEDFSVENVILKIEKILMHKINKYNVLIKKDLEKEVKISGYKNELGQVILSIINNALDKFQENSITENIIEISLKSEDKKVYLKILDNGVLIPENLLPNRLFERNVSTKKGGTGVGLAICKKIIEKSFNGEIKAYNQDNKVVFEIVLKKI